MFSRRIFSVVVSVSEEAAASELPVVFTLSALSDVDAVSVFFALSAPSDVAAVSEASSFSAACTMSLCGRRASAIWPISAPKAEGRSARACVSSVSELLEPFGLFDLSEFPESFDVSESFVSAFPLSEVPDLSEASALPESPSFSSEDSVSFLSSEDAVSPLLSSFCASFFSVSPVSEASALPESPSFSSEDAVSFLSSEDAVSPLLSSFCASSFSVSPVSEASSSSSASFSSACVVFSTVTVRLVGNLMSLSSAPMGRVCSVMSFESSSKETIVVLPVSLSSVFAETESADRSTVLATIATVKPITSMRLRSSLHLIFSWVCCQSLSGMVFFFFM